MHVHAAEVAFGYPATEAIGQRLDELLIPERYRHRHREAVQHYLPTGNGAIQVGRQQHRSLAVLYLEVGRFQEANKVLG